ncbi:hypothetical protein FOXYSP1_19477 [Fusarium oxysporum f. sp. phaseoli]
MCYYDQILWACGNWRWDRFREQCNKEHRIGETCGLKLVYGRQDQAAKCNLCTQISSKKRRIEKATRRLAWLGEHGFLASSARCKEDIVSLRSQISKLHWQHVTDMYGGGVFRKTRDLFGPFVCRIDTQVLDVFP